MEFLPRVTECDFIIDTNYSFQIDRVVSMGFNCATKAHINHFLDPKISAIKTPPGKADLFDWVVIENMDSLCQLLESQFKDFFSPEYLTLEGHVIRDTKYSIRWNHLLNSAEKKIFFNMENYYNMPHDVQQFELSHKNPIFNTIKSKIEHLKLKFVEAKNKNTLYVISDHRKEDELSWSQLLRMKNALDKIRENNQNFILLIVLTRRSKSFDLGYDPRIFVHEAPKQNDSVDWYLEENQPAWNKILETFPFSACMWDTFKSKDDIQ